jgi:monoamine oxidase
MSVANHRADSFEAIVIGAGVAGLASARTLAEAGRRVALLEARDRVGGRIHTVQAIQGDLQVELGAEFIHGLPQELIDLVDEAGLTRFELDGDSRCVGPGRGAGRLEPCGDQHEVHQLFEELGHTQLSPDKRDLSFSEFLNRLKDQRKVGPEAAAWATNYVEGFNAADADRISIRALEKQQAAEDAISADRLFRVVEGYARVPEYLLQRFRQAGGELFRSTEVQSVAWEPGQVEVATETGRVLAAKSAILTLPLGILQARRVAFLPQPVEILKAADSLVMGPAARVVYEFDSAFWKKFVALKGVSFFFAPESTPPTWWTTSPKPGSTLTGWIAGRKTKRLEMDLLPETGLETLSFMLGSTLHEVRKHLLRWHMHDWQTDPYSLGAYTYVPRGAIGASDQLSQPVAQTLFFAGEHTDTSGHWGTVHGALRSGYRAARQLLAQP